MSTSPGQPARWELAHDHGFHAAARVQEIWRYRRLVWFFARQSFVSLYAKTQLGWAWILIRPLAPLVVGALVYGGVMGVPSVEVPYFLFLLVGSIAWNAFDGPWMWGGRGIELQRKLITKLYLPRMILPAGAMARGFIEPLVYIGVLLLMLPYYRYSDGTWYLAVSWDLLTAPLFLLLAAALAFSLALWTSNWQARARDVRFGLAYFLSFWMYVTPVIYPASQVPARFQTLVWLNPMATVVEGFKGAIFGWAFPPAWAVLLACGEVLVVFLSGFWYFHLLESETTDKL
ncbi:MAG: ABC transporter permease [Vicinamibacterales bacterium]